MAALDYASAVGLSIAPWVAKSGQWSGRGQGTGDREVGTRKVASPVPLSLPYVVLGCDGFGRSEARQELRRFFEVDAENIAFAALAEWPPQGRFREKSCRRRQALRLEKNKPNQVTV